MKLYLVGSDMGGENFDLFVRANEMPDAIAEWRRYYDFAATTFPDRIWHLPFSPDGDTTAAYSWDAIPVHWLNSQAQKEVLGLRRTRQRSRHAGPQHT